MTREEAIKWFKDSPFYSEHHEPFNMAISALSVIEQTKWERDTALATLEEHGIGLGQRAEPSGARMENKE